MKTKIDYHQIRENAEMLPRYTIVFFESEIKPWNCLNCREYILLPNNMKQIFISFETKQKTSNMINYGYISLLTLSEQGLNRNRPAQR